MKSSFYARYTYLHKFTPYEKNNCINIMEYLQHWVQIVYPIVPRRQDNLETSSLQVLDRNVFLYWYVLFSKRKVRDKKPWDRAPSAGAICLTSFLRQRSCCHASACSAGLLCSWSHLPVQSASHSLVTKGRKLLIKHFWEAIDFLNKWRGIYLWEFHS